MFNIWKYKSIIRPSLVISGINSSNNEYIYMGQSQNKQRCKETTFNFSTWKVGLTILLCLAHFSPSMVERPMANSFMKGFVICVI